MPLSARNFLPDASQVKLPLINKWQSHQCCIKWHKWTIKSTKKH